MAATKTKKVASGGKGIKNTRNTPSSKRTSIGGSPNSRPNSKNAKRNWKKYRGQGRV